MTKVYTFLQMWPTSGGGFDIPDSEAVYNARTALIDIVYPGNAGVLQADGTWLQNTVGLALDFSQDLPVDARAAGQLYIPSFAFSEATMHMVLASPALQATAIADAISLATISRFDSPWDGVMLDISSIDVADYAAFDVFLTDMSEAVRQEGLPFHVAYPGIISAHAPWSTLNYALAAEVVDVVVAYCYGWWVDPILSLGPYWWAVESIEYALSQGVLPSRLVLGMPCYAKYWPVTGEDTFWPITNAQVLTLISDNAEIPEWIEKPAGDIIREKYSDVDTGHIWYPDGDTTKHRLALVTEYGLDGMALYIPGMGDDGTWDAISDWRAGAIPWHGYISVTNLNLAGGEFADLLAIVQGQGRLDNPQPSNITHSRVLSGTETIVEAVFRYGEMAQDQCIQWVAAVLVVDPADVTLAVAANVWTVTHGGTDYVTFNLFGGLDSSWAVSGAACRAYIG